MTNKIIHAQSGLVQIPVGDNWAIGYLPEKKTFCLGSLGDFADMHNTGEWALIEFRKGKLPIERLDMTSKEIENLAILQPNQVKAKLGSFFVLPHSFNPEL